MQEKRGIQKKKKEKKSGLLPDPVLTPVILTEQAAATSYVKPRSWLGGSILFKPRASPGTNGCARTEARTKDGLSPPLNGFLS